MKKILIAVVLFIVAFGAWYFLSPLILNRTVNEGFPFADMTTQDYQNLRDAVADLDMQLPTEDEMREMTAREAGKMEKEMVEKSSDKDITTNDMLPENPPSMMQDPEVNGPFVSAEGTFQDTDSFHKGSGKATIYVLADGTRYLRFENFEVTNGPDLRVLLATGSAPSDSSSLGDYVELGSLKGNKGNQNYEIPPDVDLSTYGSVVIYCKPFHVVFSFASL